MSQEIKKARLREIAQTHYKHLCLGCDCEDPDKCSCAVSGGKIVQIAFKRVKEGLGAVRD